MMQAEESAANAGVWRNQVCKNLLFAISCCLDLDSVFCL